MALTIAQYEEVLAMLREVPGLVDKLESRNAGFFDDVLGWIRRAERALTDSRQPTAAQLAVYRARLIEAGRGVRQGDLTVIGRPTTGKIKEATAALLLGQGSEVLQALITAQQSVFQDGERIARQALAIARLKGLAVMPGDGVSQQRFLQDLRDQLAADPDLASVHAHLVGLVGATDTLVLLDRALVSVR
jgi:hypothetical protein